MAQHNNRGFFRRQGGALFRGFNAPPGGAGQSPREPLGDRRKDLKRRTTLFTGGLVDRQFGFGEQAADAFGEGIQFLSRPNVISGINRFGQQAQRFGASTAQGLGGRLSQSTGNPFLSDAIRIEQSNLATGARNQFAGEQLSPEAFARRKAMEAQLRLAQASSFGTGTIDQLGTLNQQLGFGQPQQPGRPTFFENILQGFGSFAAGGGFR